MLNSVILKITKKYRMPKTFIKLIDFIFKLLTKLAPIRIKRIGELYYWRFVKSKEKCFTYDHYYQFFTSYFNLDFS